MPCREKRWGRGQKQFVQDRVELRDAYTRAKLKSRRTGFKRNSLFYTPTRFSLYGAWCIVILWMLLSLGNKAGLWRIEMRGENTYPHLTLSKLLDPSVARSRSLLVPEGLIKWEQFSTSFRRWSSRLNGWTQMFLGQRLACHECSVSVSHYSIICDRSSGTVLRVGTRGTRKVK